jgi:sortase (surface protein transpeptidase)
MEIKPKSAAKTKLRWSLLYFVIVVALAFATFFCLRFFFVDKSQTDTVQNAENSENLKDESIPEGEWLVAPEKPRFMTVERLGIIQARVVELGTFGENNQLEDPANIHDAGWYSESALPGAPFNVEYAGLYDGHNTGISQTGIFYRLDQLSLGDKITIERGDGAVFNYAVREVETVLLEEVDMAKLQKSYDPTIEGLNIISCGGDWDPARQTYTHRVTVRATIQT